LLAESTSNAALFPPQRIGNIPYLNDNEARTGQTEEQTVKGKTFKMSFPAPPAAGSTTLQVYLISDTFIGSTVVKTVVVSLNLLFHQPSWVCWHHLRKKQLSVADEELEAPVDDGEGDISDPDEDTIAGQIAMLKGQRVKKTEDGEEEDGEDEDESSDEETPRRGRNDSSDSDSDSEDESPRGKKAAVDSDSDSDWALRMYSSMVSEWDSAYQSFTERVERVRLAGSRLLFW
jgi:translocation protein SEC63